ncbi:ABC transporter ATP-binding protein [Longirhabdus pacifica]|uniref:ABC transporter ATP-binding protein n=1 Tax=Longirhabdus pacifica TaxID=2305227 RepID=UPI001F0CD045|nr:ABC transporter ATP-binding protein [Longirhabdus pacifica]
MSGIHFKDVIKRFDHHIVVDHLNLKINQGDILGLLGPNGAGKSTCIHMLCGLLPIDYGDITINDISVKQHVLEAKKLIGVVPQHIALYDHLSAEENVTFFAKLYGLKGNQLKENVANALQFVRLYDLRHEKITRFSEGQKRRLNIACAVAHNPAYLIMDEPTVCIDPQSRNHILESVKELNKQGTTVIYISHYIEEIKVLCNQIAILDHGQLIANGTKKELLSQLDLHEKVYIQVSSLMNSAAKEELENHMQVSNVLWENQQLEITLQSAQLILQDILFLLSKYEISVQSLHIEKVDLETLFLNLTSGTSHQ